MSPSKLLDLACGPRLRNGVLLVLTLFIAVLYVRFCFLASFNHDEVEHAHVGFRIAQGLLPYRDFYQNHFPAWWLVTAAAVELFPLSIEALLAPRVVGIVALALCWLLGFRLLNATPGGRTWFARLLYSWAVIALAVPFGFPVARPDPLMTLFGTAALCLLPWSGTLSAWRCLALGVVAGIALSISPKVLPMMAIIPALLVIDAARNRTLLPASALAAYGIGAALGLAPTVLWVAWNDLTGPFLFDVIDLNKALNKPWHHSFGYLHAPVFFAGAIGALAWLATRTRNLSRLSRAQLTLLLWLAAGVALGFLSRHGAPYNNLMLIIPVAVGVCCLVVVLHARIRGKRFRTLFVLAVIAYPSIHVASPLARVYDYGGIEREHLEALIALAASGDRTCTAFSPWHPIFCTDVSQLANNWDAEIPNRISDPAQLDRFRRIWQEGLAQTIRRRPHIVFREGPIDTWSLAVEAGMLDRGDIAALDAAGDGYREVAIGEGRIWLRP